MAVRGVGVHAGQRPGHVTADPSGVGRWQQTQRVDVEIVDAAADRLRARRVTVVMTPDPARLAALAGHAVNEPRALRLPVACHNTTGANTVGIGAYRYPRMPL